MNRVRPGGLQWLLNDGRRRPPPPRTRPTTQSLRGGTPRVQVTERVKRKGCTGTGVGQRAKPKAAPARGRPNNTTTPGGTRNSSSRRGRWYEKSTRTRTRNSSSRRGRGTPRAEADADADADAEQTRMQNRATKFLQRMQTRFLLLVSYYSFPTRFLDWSFRFSSSAFVSLYWRTCSFNFRKKKQTMMWQHSSVE